MIDVTATDTNGSDFFQTSGTLKANAPSYIERSADNELYESVLAGEYVYVLTPRQMGKSSLMTRTAARLRAEGVHVAVLDLTGIGGDAKSMTANEWYYGLANKMLRELDMFFALSAWWQEQVLLPPLNRLMNFFQDVVLTQLQGRVVVFVDEIDTTIKLPFSDDFFAAIRACFNARANRADFDRLCFVLLGVASPADLIRDPTRTPFNIGQRIDLTDFNFSQALHFVKGLHDGVDGERLLKRVLYWTNGHPFLTQKLCVEVLKALLTTENPEVCVDRVVKAEFLGVGRRTKEDNLKLIDDRINKAETYRLDLLNIYTKVRKGKKVQDQPQSPVHSALKLSGLVKTDDQGKLIVRNEIYKQVFDARWINSLKPSRWKQRIAVGGLMITAAALSWWLATQQLTLQSAKGIVLAWADISYPEPKMVEIPAGNFMMGSPKDEKAENEIQQQVTFSQAFSMGTHEVTFDEYDVFAVMIKHDGGCADGHEVTWPSDNGWGRGKLPVINVNWQDAQCYAEWLVKKTGKAYRLPTEAEWEYAARAGTSTTYSWGNEVSHDHANYGTELCCDGLVSGKDKWLYTSPVSSFSPNAWGLYDMAGNVWEWTCSDYVSKYDGNEKSCHSNDITNNIRSLRGASLDNSSLSMRPANRYKFVATNRRYVLGFRLVIAPLPPPVPRIKIESPCSITEVTPTSTSTTIPAIEMVTIKSGCFVMGSPETESERGQDEKQHQICVQNFEMGKYEVTQALWQSVMGNNPSNCKGDNLPVESVSWNEAQAFIKKLNQSTGEKYRLPTEAEWEYAARAGTTTPFYTGNCIKSSQANFGGDYSHCGKGDYKNLSVTVGSYEPNSWGLYDMAGNVMEWTCSEYVEIFNGNEKECSKNNDTITMLVERGGSFVWSGRFARSAQRNKIDANYHDVDVGFRLARSFR